MSRTSRLRAVKVLHTVIWAFFAACCVVIPIAAWTRRFELAMLCIGLVVVETLVLMVNAWACPLTAVAARYTEERQPNFDIYLPAWLARLNKEIFGSLFVAGVLLTAGRWLGWL